MKMKNFILNFGFTLCIININCLHLQSQNWPPLEAEWYYHHIEAGMSGPLVSGYYLMVVEKDTLVNNINCQKITRHIYYNDGQYELLNPPLIVYSDNEIFYYLQNGLFYILYDFTKEAGGSWTSRNPVEYYSSSSDLPSSASNSNTNTTYFVDSVNYVNIDGQTLKQLYVSSSTDWYFAGPIIEKIGCLHFMLPGIWGLWDPPIVGSLRCHFESDFSYTPFVPCDSIITGVNENLDFLSTFRLFPNPIKEEFYIKSTLDIASITISDFYANMLTIIPVKKGNNLYCIDSKNLKQGIYFITIKTIKNEFITNKCVKL
jgi:hypothetical protein